MKHWRFIIVLLVQLSFSQKEANIWYFGAHAGLDFNSGYPVVLTDGATYTDFGTASVADANGNLLFYSDGNTVWNKNHEVMQNGTGLLASFDAEIAYAIYQGVMAVPKPNNPNIYYLFTSDLNYGLRYSEIDMTMDNGLGSITSTKNVYLSTADQSITAVLHGNGQDIWVLTHGDAFLVSSSGVSLSPVVNFVTNYGPIKFSPNGQRLAIQTNPSTIKIYDFDNSSGLISNPKNIVVSNPYREILGIEFSPSSNLLYVSGYYDSNYVYTNNWIHILSQFDLLASNISNSKIDISSAVDPNQAVWGLQLGPDGKIYGCVSSFLSVINSPDILGPNCNFVYEGVYLEGKTTSRSLPQFIQSYFYVGIQADNVCFGESTQFHFNSSNIYDSLLWDFGDGNNSNEEAPVHTYTNSGDYTVTLTVTSGLQTSIDTKTVTIYDIPTAKKPEDLIVCNPKSFDDGFYAFNLDILKSEILNGQDPSMHEVKFYASMSDYKNHLAIESPDNYTNGDEYTLHTIIAVVKNIYSQCESMTSFNIQVFDLPDTSQSIYDFSLCDDTSVGTNYDGLIQIDLTQKESDILNGLSESIFEFSYFKDIDLQNQVANPNAYHNGSPSETIYVLVTNLNNPSCSIVTLFSFEVYSSPTVAPWVILMQCDDDLDGFSAFNLNEALSEISPNYMNETITFHEAPEDAYAGTNPIGNANTYFNQVVSTDVVYARVENGYGCFITSLVNLIVTTTQIPATFMRDFYACDLDENGEASFDFSSVNTEIEALFPSGQEPVVNYYRNLANALEEIDPIADISNYRNIGYPYAQQIYVRVDSKLDNDCIGLGAHISLHVDPLPEFSIDSPQIVCSSDPTLTVVLDPVESDIHEVLDYLWVYQDGTILSNSPTLTVSTPGIYAVTLTKSNGSNCSRTREIFVNASELASITMDNITVVDVSSNNTIAINISNLGLGDYEFALDNGFSSYQDEPIFEHVAPGIHTLFVRDKKGCGTSSIDISIIGFPKFFTPNGDGNNDTWKINGANSQFQPNSDIYIYDRYGKLLKQLVATSNGWDGTFNGTLLPSDDYWFSVNLQDGRTFKGHFALKR